MIRKFIGCFAEKKDSMQVQEDKRPWLYVPRFIPGSLAQDAWQELSAFTLKHRVESKLAAPYFVYCSNVPDKEYKYFKKVVHGCRFPSMLEQLSKLAEAFIEEQYQKKVCFDTAFLNLYPSNEIHIPWHRDTTHKDSFIASLTLQEYSSEARSFQIRDKLQIWSVNLEHASLFIMEPGMQEIYQHRVPPLETLQKARLNITFRSETK
jgi:hypothetical protein